MHETLQLPKSQAKTIAALHKAYHWAPSIQGGGDTPEKIAARAALSEKSAWLAQKHFGLKLTPQEAFLAVHYGGDWIMLNPGSMEERLDFLRATLTGTLKIDDENDPFAANKSPKNIFKTLYFWHDYTSGSRKVATAEYASTKLRSSPHSLYRLLYLFSPSSLDFSDMYKSGEFAAILSPTGEFTAAVEFWKYELALRFTAAPGYVTGQGRSIGCGIPGSDSGLKSNHPLLDKWTQTLLLALRTRWEIYPGNNFTV